MPQYLAILEPTGPVLSHAGRAEDLFFRSDTLSAAMVSCLARAGKDVDADDGWARNPPFRVSSALPMLAEKGETSVFYPVPDTLKTDEADETLGRRGIKRVMYADALWLKEKAMGHDPRAGRVIVKEQGCLFVLAWPDANRRHVLAVVNPRTSLAVDRLTGGPIEELLFEVTDILPSHPALRLGVIVECEDSVLEEVLGALQMVGLAGIGPKRTCGRGHFVLDRRVQRYQPPGLGSGACLLLSLYHPTREEVKNGVLRGASYRLVQRGGFVTSPGAMSLRRGRVTMLTEGSLVRDSAPVGDVVEVLGPRPDLGLLHPVYRDGRALAIPIARNAMGG